MTERDRSRTPLFQVFFNYEAGDSRGDGGLARRAGDDGRDGGDGVRPGATELGARGTLFDLTLNVSDGGGDLLAGALEFSTELFDAGTAERMAGHLLTLMAGVAADPAARVSRLGLLTTAERDQLAGLERRPGCRRRRRAVCTGWSRRRRRGSRMRWR